MKFGTNTAIFIIFFSVALIDAVRSGQWYLAALFVILAVLLLYADNAKKKQK